MIYGEKFVNEACMTKISDNASLNLCGVETNIYVYANEGPIPHFHINIGNDEGCIMIKESQYFDHNNNCKLKLNSTQSKELQEWMTSIPEGQSINNWKRIVEMWNRNNPEKYKTINNSCKQPNYSYIKPFK